MDQWIRNAITEINADYQRSADTHMIKLELPAHPQISLYFKDESTHPSGSLKHRLARSLFLYGLCNGWIKQGTTVVEASSGSTAVSEAYFARILKLSFIAVVPESTSEQKISQIEFYGGRCHLVPAGECIMETSRKLAKQHDGHFMDQFTFAERATDWRGNNNIAESLFKQLEREPDPIPKWIVVGAGTGGTSATIGRYIRYFGIDTRLCVVDPERSAFFDSYCDDRSVHPIYPPSRIEGIGRPTAEPSFIESVVDRMYKVDDCKSVGAMLFLEKTLGRRCGPSTGTNFIGVMQLIQEMKRKNQFGPIVTLICDSGNRYRNTYFDVDWRSKNDLCNVEAAMIEIQKFFDDGSPCSEIESSTRG